MKERKRVLFVKHRVYRRQASEERACWPVVQLSGQPRS